MAKSKSRKKSQAIRFAHTIFAEEVRPEIGGKVALLGIYRSSINFNSSAPVQLLSFVIRVTIVTPIDDPFLQSLKIILSGAGFDSAAEFPLVDGIKERPKTEDASRQYEFTIDLVMHNATFGEEGRLVVEVDTGRELLYAGSLRIIFPPEEEDGNNEEEI